jgi:hypothetical protein
MYEDPAEFQNYGSWRFWSQQACAKTALTQSCRMRRRHRSHEDTPASQKGVAATMIPSARRARLLCRCSSVWTNTSNWTIFFIYFSQVGPVMSVVKEMETNMLTTVFLE